MTLLWYEYGCDFYKMLEHTGSAILLSVSKLNHHSRRFAEYLDHDCYHILFKLANFPCARGRIILNVNALLHFPCMQLKAWN